MSCYPATNISLAICTYNNCDLLEKTLESIEKQKVSSEIIWSVLVIDNNSDDGTKELINAYILSNKIQKLNYFFEHNQGLAFARRRAISESQAQWIAFIDDDCILSQDWVEKAVSFCKRHPQAGGIGGHVELLWEREPESINLACKESLSYQYWGDSSVRLPSSGFIYLVGAGLIIQREAINDSGWLDSMKLTDRKGKKLSSGGDTEMVLLIRNAGYEIWYTPSLKLQHFIPEKRMSLSYLCELHRAFGRTDHILNLLSEKRKLNPLLYLIEFMNAFTNLIRQILGLVIWNYMSFKPTEPIRYIQIQRAFGNMEGLLNDLVSRMRLG
jgi:glycosyltransferase involved in cell wall biosynthesis